MKTSMVRSIKRHLLTIALVLVTLVTSVTPVFAATKNPYGFTYDNSANSRTIYEYYSYSGTAYKATREFYSRNVAVYTKNGTLVSKESKASGALYNGFDTEGNFFIITANGALIKSNTSNSVSTVLADGALRLIYNSDDLATTVLTTSGNKSLKTLETVADTDNGEDTMHLVNTSRNRVDMYTNSANEMVYDAYYNGKLKTSIIVSGKKILNATSGIRLSETLVGTKFMGFDTKYRVYLYESNGTLYRFKQGSWYSAEKLQLSGNFKKFTKNSNGFISSITTSKDTYSISQLTTSSKWKAKKTYAVSKNDYTILYKKGETKSNTLQLASNNLLLNGAKIASNVSKFGFTTASRIIYLKKGNLYTASIRRPDITKKVASNVKSLKLNNLGLASRYVLYNGKSKNVR